MKRSICLLSALTLLHLACGKGKEPDLPDLAPPPRMDMTTCTPTGQRPSSTPCCSGQKDSQGLCCTGSSCVSPPPPPPPGLPDLTVGSFSFGIYTRSGGAALCLNQTPTGTKTSEGHQVTIKNIGKGPAGPYGVAFGLLGVSDHKGYGCLARLVDREGLDGGEGDRWSGPLCCTLTVPGGQSYLTFVLADDQDDVEESDEKNNAAVSSQSFPVPRLQADEPAEPEAWTEAGTFAASGGMGEMSQRN